MKNNTIVLAIVATVVALFTTSSEAYSRFCNGIWQPSPGMPWMWQIGTTPTTANIDSTNAQVVDLDMYNSDVTLIDYIHSKGKAMICYIDTQYEPSRPDSANFTADLKGKPIDGWPGQYWVDIRSPVVRNIMLFRAKLAQSKGCDGIEWDDVDGYANDNGFNLQYADQISFNTYLANMTHSLGMSVGLKNDLDQVDDLVNFYDWALNEQCYQYKECDVLQAFVKQGKAVFGTEYSGTASTFCPAQNKAGYSWLLSDLDLDGKKVTQCCSFNSPACADVLYQCAGVVINNTVTSTGISINTTVTTTGIAINVSVTTGGHNPPHDTSEQLPTSSSSTLTPVAIFSVALIASFLAAFF